MSGKRKGTDPNAELASGSGVDASLVMISINGQAAMPMGRTGTPPPPAPRFLLEHTKNSLTGFFFLGTATDSVGPRHPLTRPPASDASVSAAVTRRRLHGRSKRCYGPPVSKPFPITKRRQNKAEQSDGFPPPSHPRGLDLPACLRGRPANRRTAALPAGVGYLPPPPPPHTLNSSNVLLK